MPERKHAGAPRCCFGATPLVGELPRSNGQTTAWPAAPSRPRKVDGRGKRGARKSINLNPDLDLLSSPSRSSSIAPPKPYFAAPDSSAPTRQGIKRTSPQNAGEKARRRHPDAVLARPLSLASYPVATGRPRPGQQRPRARVRLIEEQIAVPMLFWRDPSRWRATP